MLIVSLISLRTIRSWFSTTDFRGTLEEPPEVFRSARHVYATHDLTSKGTGLRFNKSGRLITVTNEETDVMEKPTRSRGLLAMDLLEGCDLNA